MTRVFSNDGGYETGDGGGCDNTHDQQSIQQLQSPQQQLQSMQSPPPPQPMQQQQPSEELLTPVGNEGI